MGGRDRQVAEGFRKLSWALVAAGLVGVVSTAVPAIRSGFSFYYLSGLLASAILLATNLPGALRATGSVTAFVVQAATLLLLGFVVELMTPAQDYGGAMLIGIALVLLVKYRSVRRRSGVGIVFACGIASSWIATIAELSWQWRDLATDAVAFTVTFAVLYFAFYEELVTTLDTNEALVELDKARVSRVGALHDSLRRTSEQYETSRERTRELAETVAALRHRISVLEESMSAEDLTPYGLTNREIDVLRRLALFQETNREIGDHLGVSERTVKSYMYSICNKVGLDSRIELIEKFRFNWSKPEAVEERPSIPQQTDRVRGLDPE